MRSSGCAVHACGVWLFFEWSGDHRDLHSFPTRRSSDLSRGAPVYHVDKEGAGQVALAALQDRKSTRLNSSHLGISYAVFCLKKKKVKDANVDVTDHDTLMTLGMLRESATAGIAPDNDRL